MIRRSPLLLRLAATTLAAACVVAASSAAHDTAAAASARHAAKVRADQSHLNGKKISRHTAMPKGNLPKWRQVFADNFSGTKLNTKTAWSAYNRGAPGSNPYTGWWMASHAVVHSGVLTLKGSVDRKASPSGRVVTAGVGLWKLPPQTYGKYEALVRMDKCTDVKYAWLLWPYSGQWPKGGEIDFAEDEGGNRATTTASLLYRNSAMQADALKKDYDSPQGGFSHWHVVGVEWTPKAVRYTIDGHYWGTTKTSHIPSKPMTFIMQTEGKAYPSQVNLGGSSCNAKVAWVTQYALR
jgi:hypothetical protein